MCSGSCGIGCYNGTVDIEENVSDDDIEKYDNLFEKFIDHNCIYVLFADYREGSRNFATSKMELFMIIDKGYILNMANFLGLSLYHVTMLFIGLVLCKKIFYITGSILVKYYNVKSFFNVFEMRMHKYKSFWGHLIYLNIRRLHKAKTYAKMFTPFQILMTSRVINLITSLVCILQTRKMA